MTKILYYTDLHYGDDFSSDVEVFGTEIYDAHKALLEYAQNSDISTLIHGGDGIMWNQDPSLMDERMDERMDVVNQQYAEYAHLDIHRLLGHREPLKLADHINIRNESYIQEIGEHAVLCVLQPNIIQSSVKGKPHSIYEYDPGAAMALLTDYDGDLSQKNIILASHFATDRKVRGFRDGIALPTGYHYNDNLRSVCSYFNQFAMDNKRTQKLSILGLHGHEHRFSFEGYNGYSAMVMPAFSQENMDKEGTPCLLFAEIDVQSPLSDQPLSIAFRQMVQEEGGSFTAQDITRRDIQKYYRPGPYADQLRVGISGFR